MSDAAPRRKPLSPWVWGCSGCSVIALIALALVTFSGVRLNERLRGESEESTGASDARALTRVPGGIVRHGVTGGNWATVEGMAFRTVDEITYTAFEMPSYWDMMGASGQGMVMPFWDKEAMVRQGARMVRAMAPSAFRACELSDGTASVIAEVPENMMIAGNGVPVWSAQGTVAIMEFIAFDAFFDDAQGPMALYTMEPGAGGEWTRLAAGDEPVWSPDGEWAAFTREEGSSSTVWRVRADGSDERRLTECAGKVIAWHEKDGECTGAYVWVWSASLVDHVPIGAEAPWEIVRAPLEEGEAETVPIKDVGVRLGVVSATERVFARRLGDAMGDHARTLFGVVDYMTGELRWLGGGVKGHWDCTARILGDRGILVMPFPAAATDSGGVPEDGWDESDDDDDDGGCSTCGGSCHVRPQEPDAEPWGVLSALDGRLRHTLSMRGEPVASPDGSRIAWVTEREGEYMGLLPMPMEDIAVFDILYPNELLSGPADVEGYSATGDAGVAPMR